MELRMISHASVLLKSGRVSILTDPWLTGDAFNDSWSLLCKPALSPAEMDEITHIWISHEHPDHLSFPSLNGIPAEQRSKITLLYQQHMSPRVCRVLRQLGFREVVELPLGRWLDMDDGISLLCCSVGSIDSMLALRSEAVTILNTNDCIITPRLAGALAKRIGPVDVLLTQFSIATWAGNPEEASVAASSLVLDRMEVLIGAFKPMITIPFASFVYFCHPENRHMNAWINTPDQVCKRLANSPTRIQFLYNGDTWSDKDGFSLNGDPLARYRADFNRIGALPYRSHPSYPLEELVPLGRKLVDAVRPAFPEALLRRVPSVHFYVEDLKTAIEFNLGAGVVQVSQRPQENCDMGLGSQALWYAFKFPWGFGALDVSGRYRLINRNADKTALYLCHLHSSDMHLKGLSQRLRERRFWDFCWSKRDEIYERVMNRWVASFNGNDRNAHVPGQRAANRLGSPLERDRRKDV